MPDGAGGTTGGLAMFFGGVIMSTAGLYLVSRTIILHTNFNDRFYGIPFGLTLLPLIVGIGFLFFSAKSPAGWVLTILGITIILAEILVSMDMVLRPITLYQGIIMFGLFTGGIGLIMRSFKTVESKIKE